MKNHKKWWRYRIYRVTKGVVRNKINVPKQWKHWMKQLRLNTWDTKYLREHYGRFYIKGRDRHFRINCFGEFQCSVPLEHFDRWSNSVGYTYPTIPQTEKEFNWVVKHMIEQTKDMK